MTISNNNGVEFGDTVYCAGCDAVRTAKVIDVGVGPTEFWGMYSNDIKLIVVCGHCESEEIDHPVDDEEEE